MRAQDLRGNVSCWIIFADGASSGNPGPGGWGTIISAPIGAIRELGGSAPHTTNNRMELKATLEGLRLVPVSAQTEVFTDSTYVIKGITQWIWNWIRNGWKSAEGKEVLNRDLWEELSREVQRIGKNLVKWSYVPGHAGIPGNERVDEIAVSFSKKYPISLFEGDAAHYGVDLSIITSSQELPQKKPTSGKKSLGPVFYLSLIGGTVAHHLTWKDCESRVKGQSGARFKKISSAEEQQAILVSWGVDPKTIAPLF